MLIAGHFLLPQTQANASSSNPTLHRSECSLCVPTTLVPAPPAPNTQAMSRFQLIFFSNCKAFPRHFQAFEGFLRQLFFFQVVQGRSGHPTLVWVKIETGKTLLRTMFQRCRKPVFFPGVWLFFSQDFTIAFFFCDGENIPVMNFYRTFQSIPRHLRRN